MNFLKLFCNGENMVYQLMNFNTAFSGSISKYIPFLMWLKYHSLFYNPNDKTTNKYLGHTIWLNVTLTCFIEKKSISVLSIFLSYNLWIFLYDVFLGLISLLVKLQVLNEDKSTINFVQIRNHFMVYYV